MLAASTWHCGTSPQPTNLVKARAQQDIGPRRGFGCPGGLSLVGSVLVAAALRKQWSHRQSKGVSRRSIKDGILASLSDDPFEKKKPDGEQVYFSVVQYVINKGAGWARKVRPALSLNSSAIRWMGPEIRKQFRYALQQNDS